MLSYVSESSKENKDDDSSVQANGTTNSDGSVPIAQPQAGDHSDGGTLQTDPPNDVTMTVSEHKTGSSVTTQAEVMPVPHSQSISKCALL